MSGNKERVLIFDASYDNSMDTAVNNIFNEFQFSWKSKKVLLKPNILSPLAPEKATTTHPSLVRAVVNRLKKEGAEVMVGDNPGVFGYGISEKAAMKSGIFEASQGCFIHLGRDPVKYPMSSRFFDHIMVSKDVLDADIIVNLPKLKTHGFTFFTGCIKNTFGYIVGGDKMRVHSSANTPKNFSEAIVDIYQIRPPELNIMDAVECMEGNGPQHGTIRRVGKVLASANGVSLDAAAVYLIGRKIKSIPHLVIASERNLGEIDISKISFNQEIKPVRKFRMPVTFFPGAGILVRNPMTASMVNCVPVVVHEKCRKCGLCVKHCPEKSMRMEKGDFPAADKKTCISCYCCQELCPEGAVKLKGGIFRFIRR